MKTLLSRLKSLRDNKHFNLNSGQAIVLIGLAAIGLIAMMGLAIDGGRLLFLRRETQNAADAAAVAAARALCTGRDPEPYALSAAAENGFDDNEIDNWVEIKAPPDEFLDDADCYGCYVEVSVKGTIEPTFIQLVYGGELAATAHAIGACNPDLYNSENQAPAIRGAWGKNECTPNGVTITGSDIYIEGGLHSNGTMKVMPSQGGGTVVGATSAVSGHDSDNVVHGQDKITWSAGTGGTGDTTNQQTSTGTCLSSCFTTFDPTIEIIPNDGSPYLTTPKDNYPVDFDITQFQSPSGKYYTDANSKSPSEFYTFPCSGDFWTWVKNNHMTGSAMDDGIYYAACDIDIKKNSGADNVTGNITIVSTGSIQVHGNGQQWEPYVTDDSGNKLLMFANENSGCGGTGAVKFSGSNNSWEGIIFAPNGSIKMSASTNNSASGCLIGYSVELSGSSNSIICDTNHSKPEPIEAMWIVD